MRTDNLGPAPATPAAPTGYVRYPVPASSSPHDVAPAPDGAVWYTGQGSGELGRLDPATGTVERIALGAPWITDGGLHAIVRVDPTTKRIHWPEWRVWPPRSNHAPHRLEDRRVGGSRVAHRCSGCAAGLG